MTKSFDQLKRKTSTAVSHLHITPEQARTAGALSSVGASSGAITGTAIGAAVGAAAKHPAQGAGIGAAIGSAIGGGAGSATGLYAGRPKRPLPQVTPKYDSVAMHRPPAAHPPLVKPKKDQFGKALSEDTKRKGAQVGLAGASIADAVGAKSALNETRSAVKVGTGLKSTLRYAGKRAAFPVVAAGIGATALAEHELKHEDDPQPPKIKGPTMAKSADEIFTKARGGQTSAVAAWREAQEAKAVTKSVDEIFANARLSKRLEPETKHGLKVGAGAGAGAGAVSGAFGGAHIAHILGASKTAGAVRGAARGGVKVGLSGAAVGAGVGMLQASKRQKKATPSPVMPS